MTHARRLLSISLVAAAVVVGSLFDTGVVAAQKAKPKSYPTEAEFSAACGPLNTPCGIRGVGGAYFDGIDGVSSYRVEGSGTTNGWAWDLNARRTTVPRQLTYDLTDRASGLAQGVLTINDTHGQIYDLSTITTVGLVHASFHLFIDRVEYVLRFAQDPQKADDGSSALEARRISATEFQIKTRDDLGLDLATYYRGNGPGAVLLGTYHVPINLRLANQ